MEAPKNLLKKYKPLIISGCSGVGKVLISKHREPLSPTYLIAFLNCSNLVSATLRDRQDLGRFMESTTTLSIKQNFKR
jgi:hypothetical protein